jgi:hypothetical protein
VIEEQRLIEIIEKALADRSRVDCEAHAEHHRFIAEWIEAQRIKKERWEDIQRQVLGWGVIAIIGTLGAITAKSLGIKL